MKNSIFTLVLSLSFIPLSYAKEFKLSSKSFNNNSVMPLKFVSDQLSGGQNISPELSWKNIPKNTQSFALVCVDTSPVANSWIHWELLNIPANVTKLEENASCNTIPEGTIENLNSFGYKGYGGPQPPAGTGIHHYIFTLFALDSKITSAKNFYSYDQFLDLLKGKIIQKASITATFSLN